LVFDTCQWAFFAVGLVGEIVRSAVALAPVLLELPVVGRFLATFQPTPESETKAVEEIQKKADQEKKTRQKKRDENNKYVIKVSDAMDCVEDNLGEGGILWEFAKSIAHIVTGGDSRTGPDVILDNIYNCLEENRLRQDTPRVTSTKRGPHRPARGHGAGRT